MRVTVEIDSRLVKIIRSPVYFIVSAFTGISVSFAPLFLYWSGQKKFFPGHEWIVLPSCVAIILLIPAFYIPIASVVIRELRMNSKLPAAKP